MPDDPNIRPGFPRPPPQPIPWIPSYTPPRAPPDNAPPTVPPPQTLPPPPGPPPPVEPPISFLPPAVEVPVTTFPFPTPEPTTVPGIGVQILRRIFGGGAIGAILIEVGSEILAEEQARRAAEREREADAEIDSIRRRIERIKRAMRVETLPDLEPAPLRR